MKILFLAANPVDVVSLLRIDEEIREMSRKIRSGPLRDQLELVSEWAVRAGDLQEALLRHQPDIVHFSGHSSQASGIILEDEAGNRKVVSRKALSDLFSILKDNVRVVVLNACYAKDQAQALTRTIDFAIGMNASIGDRAAIIFAAHFYQSLAFGRSVHEAFDLAVNQLELEGMDMAQVPALLTRDGADPFVSGFGKQSLRLPEPQAKPAPYVDRNITAGDDLIRPALTPEHKPNIRVSEQPMRVTAGGVQEEKHRPVEFLPWFFASLAISLTTDVFRRFVGGDGGWSDIAATIVQPVLFVLAVIAAALLFISRIHPANPIVKKAASLNILNGRQKVRWAIILTVIAFAIALIQWLFIPAYARFYNERGIRFQYRERPDLSLARESYQRALRLKPSYAQAHYNLAILYEDLQPEKAIEEYVLAIKYDSQLYAAYNNLARLYILRGKDNDYENALSILSQAEALSPQDEHVQYSLNKNFGWANYKLKHYALAQVYLQRAISLRKEHGGAAAHCLLAYVLREQGKDGVADECYDCVSLAPGEKDIEAGWLSDARDCFMEGEGK